MTEWDKNRISMQWHLQNNDIADFLAWSTIRATMYVGNGAVFVNPELEELRENWSLWASAVEWVGFGSDVIQSGDGYSSDPNLIIQAYHLKQWLDLTKQDITKLHSIVEVGAGYGAMALIIYRLGFRGMYYIIDFPELEVIQKHYLTETTKDVKGQGVIRWDSLPQSCDLLIASHSLSEMPIPERETLLSQVEAKEYLFASSYEYDGVDNAAWFNQFAGSMVGYGWEFYPHRWQENAFYQVGVRLEE